MLRPPSGPRIRTPRSTSGRNIAQGSVLGTLGELRIFRCSELTLEAIQQAVEDQALSLVDRGTCNRIPEPRFGEDGGERSLCAVDSAPQTAEKPVHPGSDVHCPLLGSFQDVVIGGALLLDLGRHAVEALRTVFGACQSHIGDGPRQAAVAVVERMDGHQPEVRLACFQHGVNGGRRVEPVQECSHVPTEPRSRRCFKMDVLPAYRTGDNLHGAGAVVAPCAGPDFDHAATARGKQGRVPPIQSFGGERLVIAARGVEHHFHHALDSAVRGFERADVDTQAAGDGGADLCRIQLFALDFSALEHIFSEGVEDGLLPELKAKRFHVADHPALPVADVGERLGEALPAPIEAGPVVKPMDVHSPHSMRRL